MDYEVNKLADELEQELNPNVMGEDELQGIVGKEIDAFGRFLTIRSIFNHSVDF